MKYPVQEPAEWAAYRHLPVPAKLALALRDVRLRRRARRFAKAVLTPALAPPPLEARDIVCLCVARNTIGTLPSFLAHYRRIGIARFAFVDDRSDDGTREMLADQPDVDLYTSPEDFRQSGGGLRWRDELVRRYGRNRWYVSVDSDEYLLFPGSEARTVADFVAELTASKQKRALAVMLDIYPDPSEPSRPAADEALPTASAPFFDGDSYRVTNEKLCTSVRGGPRHRVFGADMRLTKFPVIYADERTSFAGAGHHSPLPLRRNFQPVQAMLLHHKFPVGWQAGFQRIATEGTHFDGSAFYREITGHASFGTDFSFRNDESLRYLGSDDLVARGFMQDLRGTDG